MAIMRAHLTDLIRHLSPRERIKRRRRIEAMAQRWAVYLQEKHGDEAKYRCRHHMVNTAKMGSGIRNHVWAKVSRLLC